MLRACRVLNDSSGQIAMRRPTWRFRRVGSRRHPFIPQYPNHLQVTLDIRYQYAIMVSLSRHNSSACPPQLWRRRVPRQPCLPRHAILLTSSKPSAPTQLLFRQQSTPGSPLAATLMDFSAGVANKRLAALLSPLDSTLTKNRGWGVLWLTTHPVRIRILSERSESKDLSSHPTKGVCPERPSGAMGLPCHSARKPHSMNSFVF